MQPSINGVFKVVQPVQWAEIDQLMKAPLAEDTPSTLSSGGVNNCGDLADLAIPSHLKQPLWDKANKLASDDSAIVTAPGDEDGWMVKSSSGIRPHYVKISKCAFTCDDQCLSYKSMKLCSHTIALAIKTDSVRNLLKWYHSRKCTSNFSPVWSRETQINWESTISLHHR